MGMTAAVVSPRFAVPARRRGSYPPGRLLALGAGGLAVYLTVLQPPVQGVNPLPQQEPGAAGEGWFDS